ncbi:hypothetical protein HMPREF3190_00040 [Umbribacter vaginalis]|nr:hypothetical protein HMPREF3190_00040 [Coriobacteriales bacterium DNF00809]
MHAVSVLFVGSALFCLRTLGVIHTRKVHENMLVFYKYLLQAQAFYILVVRTRDAF